MIVPGTGTKGRSFFARSYKYSPTVALLTSPQSTVNAQEYKVKGRLRTRLLQYRRYQVPTSKYQGRQHVQANVLYWYYQVPEYLVQAPFFRVFTDWVQVLVEIAVASKAS